MDKTGKKIILINQEKVWDSIAQPWKTFRAKPLPEVADFLKNKKGRILDLGCGSGRNFAMIKGKGNIDSKDKIEGKIYAVDFSANMLKHAKQYAEKHGFNVEAFKALAYKLPFKNNFFDAAIFIAALHCIPYSKKRKKALQELKRVLKKGSEAMISVWDKDQPLFKNLKKESFIPWKHEGKSYIRYYHLYYRNEFLQLLKDAGFKIAKLYEKREAKGLYSSRNIIAIVKK